MGNKFPTSPACPLLSESVGIVSHRMHEEMQGAFKSSGKIALSMEELVSEIDKNRAKTKEGEQ